MPRDWWLADWEKQAIVDYHDRHPLEAHQHWHVDISYIIAGDFKAFVRHSGMTHIKTSPYYPQSNGKLERWHKSLKIESIRPNFPRNAEEATRLIADYVSHYNEVRLHSAIGYVTPADYLAGLAPEIHAERHRKLNEARIRRRVQSRDEELAVAG